MKEFAKFVIFGLVAVLLTGDAAFAETAATASGGNNIPLGAGIAIGVAALGGALGQSKAISAALEALGRNPSVSGKLNTPLILGLVFIETIVIFAFVIAYFLQGKI